jgi:hypothetical protein
MPLLTPELARRLIIEGRTAKRDVALPAKFEPGDRVVARNMHPTGHTRIPRYVRGHHGIIDRDHGVFVFPDTNAELAGEKPQHVYSVRFTARELWGAEAPAHDVLHIDLWDDYLDPA